MSHLLSFLDLLNLLGLFSLLGLVGLLRLLGLLGCLLGRGLLDSSLGLKVRELARLCLIYPPHNLRRSRHTFFATVSFLGAAFFLVTPVGLAPLVSSFAALGLVVLFTAGAVSTV